METVTDTEELILELLNRYASWEQQPFIFDGEPQDISDPVFDLLREHQNGRLVHCMVELGGVYRKFCKYRRLIEDGRYNGRVPESFIYTAWKDS